MKMFKVVVNGSEYKVGIEELAEDNSSQPSQVKAAPVAQAPQPKPAAKTQPQPTPKKPEAASTDGTVVAPMPGTVLQVAVNKGDKVTQGQTLLVLEAMKMENEIMAQADGVVEEVNVAQGVSVNAGDTLIVLSS